MGTWRFAQYHNNRDPEVEDGDRVEISATIQAPNHGGYYLSFKGLKVATEQERIVQAVADRILPIVEYGLARAALRTYYGL
ncbi:MAG: hypothetical protein QM706_07385 [Nitrospira sp.]